VSSRSLAQLASILIGLVAGVGLWRYWTGICNETCSSIRATAMILLLLVGLAIMATVAG